MGTDISIHMRFTSASHLQRSSERRILINNICAVVNNKSQFFYFVAEASIFDVFRTDPVAVMPPR